MLTVMQLGIGVLAFCPEAYGHPESITCQSVSVFCILWCHPDGQLFDSPLQSLSPHREACSTGGFIFTCKTNVEVF